MSKPDKEDLGTLADYIRHPEWYTTRVDEDLDWVIEKKKPEELEDNK